MKKSIIATGSIVTMLVMVSVSVISANILVDSTSISANELEQMMSFDKNLLIIDIRDTESYMNNHISGSAVDVMEETTLEKRINTMNSRIPDISANAHVILVGDSDSLTSSSAKLMNDAGIKTSFLDGGMDSWSGNLLSKKTSTIITSNELYQQIQKQEDIYLLDVREPTELEVTMISNSVNIPLTSVFNTGQISEIPTDKPVVVICASGNRATIATYGLAKHGIDFQVLDGGIKAWDNYLQENNLSKI